MRAVLVAEGSHALWVFVDPFGGIGPREENSTRLDAFKELINGDYWDRIVNEIDARTS